MTESERIQLMADYRETEMAVIAMLNAPGVFQNVSTQRSVLYRVQREDRIERIAAKFGTTVQAIVDANRLEYPFVDTDMKNPVSGVAIAGTELSIPSANGTVETVTMRQEDAEDRKYGTDLEFDFTAGDLVINDSDSDCELVRGVSMILQQYKIMFKTRTGRLIDILAYGNPLRVGNLQNMWRLALDKINLLNAIKTDRRAKAAFVNSISGDGQGGTTYNWTVQIGDVTKTGEAELL